MLTSFKSVISTRDAEFIDADVELEFSRSQLKKTQSQLRSTLIFCSCFYLAFSISDIGILGYTRETLNLFLIRLAVSLIAACGCALIFYKPQSIAMTRFVASAVEIVGMAAFLQVVLYLPTAIPWHAMSMGLMVIVVYIYIPNRLIYSCAIALAATFGFVIMAVQQARLQQAEILTMTMLLLLANTFGFVAAHRYHFLRREEYRVQSVLKDQSIRDSLTGCYNRHYLQQALLDVEIVRAKRLKLHLTVIMCDLDHFKLINDAYGHKGGDTVLSKFASMLLTSTRIDVDSVVRYGGEEFLIVLPGTDFIGGSTFAERIRSEFAALKIVCGSHSEISVTASFGVASVDFSSTNSIFYLHDLISKADILLYAAKNGGRNQVKSLQFA